MHIKTFGNVVIAIGVLIALASLLADTLGYGGNPSFGPGQVTWLICGPILAFVGFKLRDQSDV